MCLDLVRQSRLGEFRWVAFWFGRYGQSRWIMLGSVGVSYVLVRQARWVQLGNVPVRLRYGRCGEFSLGLASPGKAGSVWLLRFVVVW